MLVRLVSSCLLICYFLPPGESWNTLFIFCIPFACTSFISLSYKGCNIVVALVLISWEPHKPIARDHFPLILQQRPSHLSNQSRLCLPLLNFCFPLGSIKHYLWFTMMFIRALSKVGCLGKHKLPNKLMALWGAACWGENKL